jgi:hypothetical protein
MIFQDPGQSPVADNSGLIASAPAVDQGSSTDVYQVDVAPAYSDGGGHDASALDPIGN